MAKGQTTSILEGHDVCVIFTYDGQPVPNCGKIREAAFRAPHVIVVIDFADGDVQAHTLTAEQFCALACDGTTSKGDFEFTLVDG